MGRLTDETSRLLDECDTDCISEGASDRIKDRIKKLHRLLSEVNGFRRVGEDFNEAHRLYRERVPKVIVNLMDVGALEITESRYDTILESPEVRGSKFTYDSVMEYQVTHVPPASWKDVASA